MKKFVVILIFGLIVFDIFIWRSIIFAGPNKNLEAYFLNVGQGDSELVILPGNVKVLIDGGPNNKVLENLSKIFSATDRYIDLVILSHPQADHFNGLIDVFKNYQVGAFIYNGQSGTANSWQELVKAVKNSKTPAIVLAQGDKIHYQNNHLNFIYPDKIALKNKDLNDAALVGRLQNDDLTFLFTADIESKIEKILIQKYDLKTDVLKVSHHGSKYSSSNQFLKEARPKLSIIEVGKNSYGHPTKEVLNRLASVDSKIFRTDKDGMIKITADDGKLLVFKSN